MMSEDCASPTAFRGAGVDQCAAKKRDTSVSPVPLGHPGVSSFRFISRFKW